MKILIVVGDLPILKIKNKFGHFKNIKEKLHH